MIESVIRPKKPKSKGWIQADPPPLWATLGYAREVWYFPERGLLVISAVEVAHDFNDIDKGPEYHVSVSKSGGQRCTSNEAKFVCKAFRMVEADEDNHTPYGVVRNFWKPVAEKFIGHVCLCKDEEPAMVEDKGDYVWRGITR